MAKAFEVLITPENGVNNLHKVTEEGEWTSVGTRTCQSSRSLINHEITASPSPIGINRGDWSDDYDGCDGCSNRDDSADSSKKADYVVTLKKHHPTLYKQVKTWFETARTNLRELKWVKIPERKQHIRSVATRKVGAVPVGVLGGLYKQEDWTDIPTIVIVEPGRYLWNKTTHELQFYLSSLPVDAQLNRRAPRQHCRIENQEHWILDVTFNEEKMSHSVVE